MRTSTTQYRAILFTIAAATLGGFPLLAADEQKVAEKPVAEKSVADKDGWSPLFNGKDLEGWKSVEFGGEGEVRFEKGVVVVGQGVDLSGIVSTRKDFPKTNYEVEFEAKRFNGSDFFVGLTFPVAESHCSLICGGWGGGVTGLSSLDGMDAVENDTTGHVSFTNGSWYKVRLKVTPQKLVAWLDGKSLVDVEIEGRKVDVRFEMDICKPLSFCTYQSTAHIRNARIRNLPDTAKAVEASDSRPAE